jgi:hypothetical protein
MSEDIDMRNRGIRVIALARLIALVGTIILFCPISGISQYYYLNTYENPQGLDSEMPSADVYIKSINLDSASIEESIRLNGRGFYDFKRPALITLNNNNFLITLIQDGIGPAKNTNPQDDLKVFFSIFRANGGDLTPIRIDSVSAASVETFRQYQGEEGFRFGLRRNSDTSMIYSTGIYGLNANFNFRYLRPRQSGADEPGLIRNIGSFDFLIKVPFDSENHLYYTIPDDSQWWLVKLNASLNSVEGSLKLRTSGGANTLFAYNPLRGKFYCLHVNYEMHTNIVAMDSTYKRRQDYYVNPNVWIIDPQTLNVIEEHPIADFPEGQYPGQDDGIAEVVGNYIVYYFFKSDEGNRFDPAMLLIFDTRTNEATWLRVGWR